MTVVDNLFSKGTPDLQIGEIVLEVVLPISGIVELDQQADSSEFKRDIVKVIAWFVDDRYFGNWNLWNRNRAKEDKFQAFMQLVRKNEIQEITHKGLNSMGFGFAVIRRVEPEFKKSVIVVAFDLEQRNSLEDKKKRRQQITLADPKKIEDTVKAAEAKLNQAQQDQVDSNTILDKLNDLLKGLWEK